MKQSWRGALSTLCLGLLLFSPHLAQAQGVDLNQLQVPIIQGNNLVTVLGKLLANVILPLLGILAFVYVLYGGFTYLTAGGDPARAAQAQRSILNAIIGIIIIFLSYALVRFVIRSLGNQGGATTKQTQTSSGSQSGTTSGTTTGSSSGQNSALPSNSVLKGTVSYPPPSVGDPSAVIVTLDFGTQSFTVAPNPDGTYTLAGLPSGQYSALLKGAEISDTKYWCSTFAGSMDGKTTYIKTSVMRQCNN